MKRLLILFTFFTAIFSIILEVIAIIGSTHSMPNFLTPSFTFAITLTLAAFVTLIFSLYLGIGYKKSISQKKLKVEISILVNKLEGAYNAVINKGTLEITKETSNDVYEVIRIASSTSQVALLFLSTKIEEQMIVRLQEAGLQSQTNYVLSHDFLDEAVKKGLIPLEIVSAFHDFISMRNKIAHNAGFEVNEDTIISLLSIGIELLKIISTRSSKDSGPASSDIV